MHIRDATAADFDAILALNAESVQFLSAMDAARLAQLHAQATYRRVLEVDGSVAAFLLAFREGADYNSPNYRWFAARYPRFLYIDRVVVSATQHGRGAGRLFYQDLMAFAQQSNVELVTCEIDADPPNPRSQRFHEAWGFCEVGTQHYGVHHKLVSLQALRLAG